MIDTQTYFVYGRLLDDLKLHEAQTYTVTAYSSRYTGNELVDTTRVTHSDTHYGLYLPEGRYQLLVLTDLDNNQIIDQSEVIGRRQLEVNYETNADRVMDNIDIQLVGQRSVEWAISIPQPEITQSQDSLFFPEGAIRELSDPLFSAEIAALGMYEPAAFLEKAPTLFYALEEESYKIPVVFVHGIGGSAREFQKIVERLDRQRFKPWFFYYPSGSDLSQMGKMFYNMFLSGKVIRTGSMPLIIVAHSMGGLVVRDAFNHCRGVPCDNNAELFVTIASPFNGHPSAAKGEKRGPLVLPSWRNLNPKSLFIKRLFRKPLPPRVRHHLLYAYLNAEGPDFGEGSDGVVPLVSQLRVDAQHQSATQVGFNQSHAGVLTDDRVIERIIKLINRVTSVYPDSHIEILQTGGYDVILDGKYSEREKYYLRTMGKYFYLLTKGRIDPSGRPHLERFVRVSQGKARPKTVAESAWLKFIKDYPLYSY